MEVTQKQMFFFKAIINGTPFEYGRVAASQSEAANSLADDLEAYAKELRQVGKSNLKPS
jgi:hypothetical protein